MEESKRIKISKKNIMEFDGLKEANERVVEKYLETINTNSKGVIYATICMILFVIGVIGFCATPTILKNLNIYVSISIIILSTISLITAIFFLIVDILEREKVLYAQRGRAYIADCYVYDKEKKIKKDSNGNEITYYDVKVEDKKGHYIDFWYSVDKKSFESNEKPLKLIVFDYESKYTYDVRTYKALGIKDKNEEKEI